MYLFNGLLRRRQVSEGSANSPGVGTVNGVLSNETTSMSSVVSLTMTGTIPLSTSSPSQSSPTSGAASPANSAGTLPDTSNNGGQANIIIPVIVCFAAVLLVVFFVIVCRSCRRKHKNPKYIPTKFLKQKWERWQPYGSTSYRLQSNENLARASSQVQFNTSTVPEVVVGAGVDRHTSVRSVMTLPAYRLSALDNEQVLGREGERGGIDTVIEFPEAAEDVEARREEEMEALYQVRLARRRENEEREERRRLRREARERRDWVALRELQNQATLSSAENAGRTVAELRAEHDRLKAERQRAVSSVSYADLGIARHDGTRIRANSEESERQGLLGDAGSIASSRYHRRDRSTGSVISIDTMNSDLPSPGLTRSRANSRGESPLRRVNTAASANSGHAGSSPEIINHDDVPSTSPPEYEDISLNTSHNENPPNATPQIIPSEPPPDYPSHVYDRGEPRPPIGDAEARAGGGGDLATEDARPTPDSRSSSGASMPTTSSERRVSTGAQRTSRGVGGVPQLPSLRLGSLPSIVVDAGTPVRQRQSQIDEE